MPGEPLFPSLPEIHDEALQRLAGPWTKALVHAGVAVNPIVVDDSKPREALLATAQTWDVDVLVLGARIFGGVGLLRHDGMRSRCRRSERALD